MVGRNGSDGMDEVLFEFHRRGNYVRVSAIDPISNIEVTIVGDANQSELMLKRIAFRKLLYVIRKRQGGNGESGSSSGGGGGRGGLIA